MNENNIAIEAAAAERKDGASMTVSLEQRFGLTDVLAV
jgi:hypothetical protein